MIERQAIVDELANIVFDISLTRMKYFRESVALLSDEETIALFEKIDAIFQRYAENI